jgi:hypothetical protein
MKLIVGTIVMLELFLSENLRADALAGRCSRPTEGTFLYPLGL